MERRGNERKEEIDKVRWSLRPGVSPNERFFWSSTDEETPPKLLEMYVLSGKL